MFGGDAVVLSIYLIVCMACMAVGMAVTTRAARMTGWQGPCCWVRSLSAVIAFAQVFELWEGFPWINRMPDLRRPGANLGQPNHLATLLVMGLASLLFLFESRRLGATASGLLALTLLTGLAATESRTGVLSFLF